VTNTSTRASHRDSMRIGARVLREDQAAILLPHYMNLHNQVRDFRAQAAILRGIYGKEEWFMRDFRANYNNVISILGERGSGKSSVMLTFKYHHTKNFIANDIVLPLIAPDQMSDASNTLGWVISFLHDEMLRLKDHLRTNPKKPAYWQSKEDCAKESKDQVDVAYKELQKAYLLRQETYASIIRKRDEGLYEQMRDNERIINSDQQLIERFHTLIGELLSLKRELSEEEEVEPLILIFFDDVDISAGRCAEVLDTVRNFLSHPNIVVFVSGAYNVFLEAMTIHMLQEEKVHPSSYGLDYVEKLVNKQSALMRRQERSREYIKKVLPPAYRYDMTAGLTEQEKSEFKYYLDVESEELPPTMNTLMAGIKNVADGRGVLEPEHAGGPIPLAYFQIFDANPRGLINPFYYLYQRKDAGWNGLDVLQFLEIVIRSNPLLLDNKALVKAIIRVQFNAAGTELDQSRTFIHYSRLQSEEWMNEQDAASTQFLTLRITILLLADWIERMLRMFAPNFRVQDEMKTKLLANLWNELSGAGMFPFVESMNDLLALYNRMDTVMSLTDRNKPFFDTNAETHYLQRKYMGQLAGEKPLYEVLRSHFDNDRNWTARILNYIGSTGKSDAEIMNQTITQAKRDNLFWNGTHQSVLSVKAKNWLKSGSKQAIAAFATRLEEASRSAQFDGRSNASKVEDAIRYILLSGSRTEARIELSQLVEKTEACRQRIAQLEQSRWLSRDNDKNNRKKIDKVSIVEKRIKKLEKELSVLREWEIKSLIAEYFTEENIEIDRVDIEYAYDPESGDAVLEPFINANDDEEYLTFFHPLLILREYVDIQIARQLVKVEELDFTFLNYDSSSETEDLTSEQQEQVKDYFEKQKEIRLLKLLLPSGKTTKHDELLELKNEFAEGKGTIAIHEDVVADLVQQAEALITGLQKEDPPLAELLLRWEYTRAPLDMAEVMKKLAACYTAEENGAIAPFVEKLLRDSRLHQQQRDLWSTRQLRGFIKDASKLFRMWIERRREDIGKRPESQRSMWEQIVVLAEIDDNEGLIPSLHSYIITEFGQQTMRIAADEEADGSIAYFRALKSELKERSRQGYSAFDLHVQQSFESELG